MALPLPLRNRLADLVLDALHDADAREGLRALAAVCADPRAPEGARPPARFPLEFFERGGEGLAVRGGFAAHARELADRAKAAWHAVGARALGPAAPSLAETLDAAGALFDAGLYFEVHELLEPCWFRALGREREALQGLIQIAVGYQHLANGNLAGARALLDEGRRRLDGRTLEGLDLDAFGQKVARTSDRIQKLDWRTVPPFPRPQSGPRAGGAAGKAVNPRKELS